MCSRHQYTIPTNVHNLYGKKHPQTEKVVYGPVNSMEDWWVNLGVHVHAGKCGRNACMYRNCFTPYIRMWQFFTQAKLLALECGVRQGAKSDLSCVWDLHKLLMQLMANTFNY